MPIRVILLRIMLWALGLAAVIGVAAVLFEGGDLAWRVVGTAVATAVACALMMAASRLVDREKSRSAGLLGMGAVILEFLGSLILIWELPRYLFGGGYEEQIALTMLYLGMAVLLVMVLLRGSQSPSGAVASHVGIWLTLTAFLVFVLAIWDPAQHPGVSYWWETGGAITVLGGLAVGSLIGLRPGDHRYWRWAGVLASIVACVMWLSEIWIGLGSDPGFVIFCVLLSLAAVIVHANLSIMCPLAVGQGWVRAVAIFAAILTAACLDVLAADDRLNLAAVDGQLFGRLAAAAGIVTGCGTLALAVLARLNRVVDFEPLSAELTTVTVLCPRCGKKQSLRIGDSACVSCKLRISIKIEEPRCPQCGYLLYGLPSNCCPECGTTVAV
ncbi:MAG: hypothetical protein JSU63_04085 [Phycisphaerales bacterium]|nr:MAG: hypothetical protein JSU63_04085 [Phycisphaerales bacterium]